MAADWLSDDSRSESENEYRARGGALSAAGRREAVASSLALLGGYFASGSLPQKQFNAGSRGPDQVGNTAVLAGIRLRIALAAADELLRIMQNIGRRQSFRYHLRSVDQEGSLTSQLDVNRWAVQRGIVQDVPVFPAFESQRISTTPENILATFAVQWVRSEMKSSLAGSAAVKQSIESRTYRERDNELARLVRNPAFAQCRTAAAQLKSTRSVKELVDQVGRRVSRREMPNPSAYLELAAWVSQSLGGQPVVDPGNVSLEFYGEEFDTTLFELWCLHHLMKNLALNLDVPEPQVRTGWTGSGLTYTLNHFVGSIDLHYQNELTTTLSLSGRWRRTDGAVLRGRPDIVAVARPRLGDSTAVIIDPKLRQRSGMPTEEIYKLLGYFENFDLQPRRGAILFHTTDPSNHHHYELHGDASEHIIAARLNPASSDDSSGLQLISDLIISSLGIQSRSTQASRTIGNTEDDHVLVLRDQLSAWARSHEQNLVASRNMLEGILGHDRWNLLDVESQTMLSTALCIGNELDGVADYSGPVIGLCTAIERLLHEHIAGPLITVHPSHRRQLIMLGSLVEAIRLGCSISLGTRPSDEGLHNDVASFLDSNPDLAAEHLEPLTTRWAEMNRTFRRPAAHREIMSRGEWQAALRTFLGENLLADSIDTLSANQQ